MAAKVEFDRSMEESRTNSSSAVEGMIRKLVASARSDSPKPARPAATALESKGVILKTEVDGVRYLLVREDSPVANEFGLSPREREIVRMIAKGYPNKTIATVLEISSWTVGTHLRRIFAKVGVNTRAALIAATSHFQGFEPDAPGRGIMSRPPAIPKDPAEPKQ